MDCPKYKTWAVNKKKHTHTQIQRYHIQTEIRRVILNWIKSVNVSQSVIPNKIEQKERISMFRFVIHYLATACTELFLKRIAFLLSSASVIEMNRRSCNISATYQYFLTGVVGFIFFFAQHKNPFQSIRAFFIVVAIFFLSLIATNGKIVEKFSELVRIAWNAFAIQLSLRATELPLV